MGHFTFIPVWILQDLVVYIAAMATVFYIVKHAKHPVPFLMEFVCFVFLYGAVFENLATIQGMYGYGRSLLMVFNVPLSIPVIEYLIIYSALKLLETMQIPVPVKPLIAGLFGVLGDLSLDPVAVQQVYATAEGTIGRWAWFPEPGTVQIYGEPVLNFTGWLFLCGYAAATLLVGRWWFKRSNYSTLVGYVYPVLAALVALLFMFSPISPFLIYLAPFFKGGGLVECIMFGVALVVPFMLLAIFWRGRMTAHLSLRRDFIIYFNLGGFHVFNIIFCIAGGYFEILWLISLAAAVNWLLLAYIWARGRKEPALAEI